MPIKYMLIKHRWSTPLIIMALAFSLPTGASDSFSHDDWNSVLQEFVNDEGLVNYQALERDRQTLDGYLARIAQVGPESRPDIFPTKDAALAFHINAYNAYVFNGVLESGTDIESVWPTLFAGYKFFVRMKIIVDGDKTNLKALEDKKIREQFKDPRIHAALNCASISCPRLPREAFEPETLNEQLDSAMREFVSVPQHFKLDTTQQTVYISKIFDWFSGDFLDEEKQRGNRKPSLIDYVNRYRPADGQVPSHYKLKFLPYDKGLNRQ